MWKKRLATLVSPWLYSASWLTGNSFWAEKALRADPCNLRALHLLPLPSGQRRTVLGLRHAALLSSFLGERQACRLVELLPVSKSQNHQDLVGLLVAGERRNGYFIEVGVGDGTELSNTFLMEKNYSWSGLLIEPNRSFHEPILRTRRAKLDTRAAFSGSGNQLPLVANSYLSRLAEPSEAGSSTLQDNVYQVTTVTLDQALNEAGAPRDIDFVSIDTEGSEISVLQGLNLARWRVGMLTIEHNFNEKRRRQYAELLEPQGYARVLDVPSLIDDWFIHRDYAPDFLRELKK